MNTVLFAAARHAARRNSPRVPPPLFNFFADSRSAREFARELNGEPVLHVPNPIILIVGGFSRDQEKVIHALQTSRGKPIQSVELAPRTEREMRLHIEAVISQEAEQDICLALTTAHHFQSHSLAHYATASTVSLRPLFSQKHREIPIKLRFYLTAPSGITLSSDLARRCRVIELADY